MSRHDKRYRSEAMSPAAVEKSEKKIFSDLVEFAFILGWGTPDVFSLKSNVKHFYCF